MTQQIHVEICVGSLAFGGLMNRLLDYQAFYWKERRDMIQTDAIHMHLRWGLSFIYHVINLHPITE